MLRALIVLGQGRWWIAGTVRSGKMTIMNYTVSSVEVEGTEIEKVVQNRSSKVICFTISCICEVKIRISQLTCPTYRVRYRLGKFIKVKLSIAVQIGLHDSFVNYLLQLLVLQTGIKCSIFDMIQKSNLEIVPNHHFENQEQFPVRDVAVPVYIIDLESNYVQGSNKARLIN